jgi:hypothetical protein
LFGVVQDCVLHRRDDISHNIRIVRLVSGRIYHCVYPQLERERSRFTNTRHDRNRNFVPAGQPCERRVASEHAPEERYRNDQAAPALAFGDHQDRAAAFKDAWKGGRSIPAVNDAHVATGDEVFLPGAESRQGEAVRDYVDRPENLAQRVGG